MIRASAGMMSPTEREMISPGTSTVMGRLPQLPVPAQTAAFVMIFCLSSSAAFPPCIPRKIQA